MGLTIAYKYKKYHQISLIYGGFTVLLMGVVYYLTVINYTLWIFESQLIAIYNVLVYNTILMSITFVFFFFLLTEIKFYKIKKIQSTIRLYAIISNLLFDIYVFYAYFTNPTLLGEFVPPADAVVKGFILIYYIYGVLICCIGGILIGIEGVKSNLSDVKLKGKFLLIAFIIFMVATIIDPFATAIRSLDLLVTILQAFAAICFYFGFILPDWLKSYLIKSK